RESKWGHQYLATMAQPTRRHTLTARAVVDHHLDDRARMCRSALRGGMLVLVAILVISAGG
ncbi:MAG: hypothetical protein OEW91_01095, partial [Acidimicrobiia bacterium]|nr:hypothetical protein [Acidimicrobiia bacterium]